MLRKTAGAANTSTRGAGVGARISLARGLGSIADFPHDAANALRTRPAASLAYFGHVVTDLTLCDIDAETGSSRKSHRRREDFLARHKKASIDTRWIFRTAKAVAPPLNLMPM